MLSASKSGSASGASGYNLTRSLRFRSAATAWLGRTPASATNQTTWTWSGWVKRGVLSSGTVQTLFNASIDANNFTELRFTDTSNGVFEFTYVVGGADTARLTTTQVFRDPSAYYHVIFVADTTQATAANRLKLYVNGAQVTAFSTATYPSLNANLYVNSANTHGIGITRAVGRYYDGYMTEINLIDGQALTPSSFGSTNALTGVWQPARYTGTYGTNGFYLPFTDNSALTTSSNVGLGKDFSGNGNYWTTNNISITAGVTYDSMTDVPTLTSATASNFCVLNPLDKNLSNITIDNGNLRATGAASNYGARATFAMPSGKWYWEITITDIGAGSFVGMADAAWALSFVGSSSGSYAYYNGGTKYNNGSSVAYGASYTTGDVLGIAYDATIGSLTFYKNNTSQGVAYTGLTGLYHPAVSVNASTNLGFNAGQRPFTYTAPTGFVALNTYNLPTSTIVKGNTVMDATLWTGNGTSQTITNAAGFKPDLIWNKMRSGAYYNILTDSVRGTNSQLFSNDTLAQETRTDRITAINSNGFSVGSYTDVNANTQTFVGWQWQAGQGSSSSNTNGSITSTVSVNASAGFSVVTYTGTAVAGTIGHGLGVAPQLIIVKPRAATITTDSWNVYHVSTGNTNFLVLNATDASAAASNRWNNTSPTSSVFSIGTVPSSVAVGYVAYCWTPIAGFSAFGSISANSSADNAFVYTGFLPRFVLLKRTDSTSNWYIWDTARNTFNVFGNELYPNLSNAETSATDLDVLSNGFKLRSASFSGTWIYAAFATTPFKNSLGF